MAIRIFAMHTTAAGQESGLFPSCNFLFDFLSIQGISRGAAGAGFRWYFIGNFNEKPVDYQIPGSHPARMMQQVGNSVIRAAAVNP